MRRSTAALCLRRELPEPGARNFACGVNYPAPGWFKFACGANYPHQALKGQFEGGYWLFCILCGESRSGVGT